MIKSREIKNRAIATSAAAQVVLSGMENVAKDTAASAKVLNEAVLPLFGIRWGMETCQRMGSQIRHFIYGDCVTRICHLEITPKFGGCYVKRKIYPDQFHSTGNNGDPC